jgi:hypothetical protein
MQKNKIEISREQFITCTKLIVKMVVFCAVIGFLLNQYIPLNYTSEIYITPGILNKKETDPKSMLIAMRNINFYEGILTSQPKIRILQDGKTICLSISSSDKSLLNEKIKKLQNLILKKQNLAQEKIITAKKNRLDLLNLEIDQLKKTIEKNSSNLIQSLLFNQLYSNLVVEKNRNEDSLEGVELTRVETHEVILGKPPFLPLSILIGFLLGSLLCFFRFYIKIK